MGEVIDFDFKKGQRIEEKPDLLEDSEKSNEGVATEFFHFIDESNGTKKANLAKAFVRFSNENAEKLNNLQATPFARKEAEKLVNGYTTTEMVIRLIDSTEDDWQKKPAFYRVMFQELKNRVRNKNFKKEEWEYEEGEAGESNTGNQLRKLSDDELEGVNKKYIKL